MPKFTTLPLLTASPVSAAIVTVLKAAFRMAFVTLVPVYKCRASSSVGTSSLLVKLTDFGTVDNWILMTPPWAHS